MRLSNYVIKRQVFHDGTKGGKYLALYFHNGISRNVMLSCSVSENELFELCRKALRIAYNDRNLQLNDDDKLYDAMSKYLTELRNDM